jgi:carboxymethylenebutenolidase
MYRSFALCALLLLLFAGRINAQSCCANSGDFPLLAMNDDFIAAHLAPLPLNYSPGHGSIVNFETLDGKDGRAFYLPSDQHATSVLLIFHEWWGLNDYIKREAERWQGLLGNVDVYAVDLYDGQVATDQATASKLSSSLNKKRAENIIKGVLAASGKDKRVATLGWCMGGTWSLNAALLAGDRSAATVMYYGFPEKDQKKISNLKSDILYIWGSQDKFITRDVVEHFQNQVQEAGRYMTLHTFNADHAFANPSNPKHDKAASAQAEELALKFLKEKLQLE